jgi:hypothetical protein
MSQFAELMVTIAEATAGVALPPDLLAPPAAGTTITTTADAWAARVRADASWSTRYDLTPSRLRRPSSQSPPR